MNDQELDISIVIPAYNERWRILGTLLEFVEHLEKLRLSYEVVVVDDGSTDETNELVARLSRLRPQIKILRFDINHGKGFAVRKGVLAALGKLILFADADGATPAPEVDRLLSALQQGSEIAIGSRALSSTEVKVSTWFHRKFLGRFFNFIVNLVVLPDIADTQCGFKLFTRKAARFTFARSQANGFSFDVEILILARKAGISVKEVPVNWTNMPGSKVNVIWDGLKMLRDVIVFRFRHRKINRSTYEAFLLGN